jgi:hypothetical protein
VSCVRVRMRACVGGDVPAGATSPPAPAPATVNAAAASGPLASAGPNNTHACMHAQRSTRVCRPRRALGVSSEKSVLPWMRPAAFQVLCPWRTCCTSAESTHAARHGTDARRRHAPARRGAARAAAAAPAAARRGGRPAA